MRKILRTKKGYGNFGNLSKNYDRVRKGFPAETIDYILKKIGKEKPYILDMGCGTGIATEELREKGACVVGTDIDAKMIHQAEANNRYQIKYYVAPAEKQPFEDKKFDAVTAFSAFHWFTNKKVLDEIKRVLKPKGFFFAVNKNEVGDFKKKNKKILHRFIKKKPPDVKKKYNPKKILGGNNFRPVEEKTFPITEYFNPAEAVDYVQTMSIWNLLPEKKKREALEQLSKHFKRIMRNGRVERQLDIVVISGNSST